MEKKVVPPKYVMQTLLTLRARGHLAYLVGGCVRDMVMDVRPQDWDVCTSALPSEVLAIFPQARPTGLKHGTVTVLIGSRAVEVTTFRTESGYADHRHPDSVRFVSDLRGDLSRRDFTMNAMAISPEGDVMDPFGGVADIQNKRIRCVGDPDRRFEEDALRMLRALRFAARLGFAVEAQTLAAIARKAHLAGELAAERVREELEKILLSAAPQTVWPLMSLGLTDAFAARPGEEEGFQMLTRLPRKPLNRWAGLCMILYRQGCIPSAEDFLSRLRLDSRTIRVCAGAEAVLSGPTPETALEWKRLLHRFGVDSVSCAAHCADAMNGSRRYTRTLKAVLKSGDCFSIKHLAVSGDDLLALGLKGRALGEMLDFLLDYVMEYPQNNKRELLLALAASGED